MDDKVSRLVASLCASFAFLLTSPATAATINLSPNGVDDTPQLQAALDTCSGAAGQCRIVLAAGTFRTSFLLVENFRGQLRGQGAGRTVIQPVLGRQLKPSLTPFAAPPTLAAPYPVLLHFTGSSEVSISDLTLDFPSQMSIAGWRVDFWNTLLAAIWVDGGSEDRARLSVARVEVLARPCRKQFTLLSNVMAAIAFGGKRSWLQSPGSDDPERLAGGRVAITESYVRGTGIAFAVHEASAVDVRIVDNDIQGTHKHAVSLFDVWGSRVRVVDNRIAAEGTVINNYRGLRTSLGDGQAAMPDGQPTRFLVARNVINFSAPGNAPFGPFGADPIVSVDWLAFRAEPLPGAGIDTWVIRDNDIVMEARGRAITVIGDRGHALITRNRIYGREGAEGIILESSQGTRTLRNVFVDWPAGAEQLRLGAFTEHCTILEPGGIVLDMGQDNRVVAAEVRHSP